MPFSIITGVMVGGRTYDVNAATSHRTFQFCWVPLPHRSQILFQDVVPFKGGRSFSFGKSLGIFTNCKGDGRCLKPMLALQRCHKVQILHVWE